MSRTGILLVEDEPARGVGEPLGRPSEPPAEHDPRSGDAPAPVLTLWLPRAR